MNKQKLETRQYIDERIRQVLAIKALKRISQIVEQIKADERKARAAVYIFALLFAVIALSLYFIVSHSHG